MSVSIDPVCEMEVDEATAAATTVYGGRTYYFCALGCKIAFDLEPERYVNRDSNAGAGGGGTATSADQSASRETMVADVIKRRRSIARFRTDAVPREAIEQMLDAAVWAPNHHLTEPWEFFILTGDAKRRFAEIRRAFRRTLLKNPDAPEVQAALRKVYNDTVATPYIVVVTTTVPVDPDLRDDDFGATMCAIQNMLLVATDLGLGTYLRTGGFIHYEPLLRFLSVPPERRIAGIIYVGYPDHVPQRRRTASIQKARWLE